MKLMQSINRPASSPARGAPTQHNANTDDDDARGSLFRGSPKVDVIVGVDFGAPQRARDQRQKIIAIEHSPRQLDRQPAHGSPAAPASRYERAAPNKPVRRHSGSRLPRRR